MLKMFRNMTSEVNENWKILSVAKIILTKNKRTKIFAETMNKKKNFLLKS